MPTEPKRIHIRYVLTSLVKRQGTRALLESGITYQEALWSLEWTLNVGLVTRANAKLELTELGRRFLEEPGEEAVRIASDPLAIARRSTDVDAILLPAEDVR